MKTTTNYILSATNIFKSYKELAEKAMAQLNNEQLFWQPDAESNSIYLIVKHLSGNMLSRWTDFLTTDGEKEWRNRDGEFDVGKDIKKLRDEGMRENLMKIWAEGWKCLFDTLAQLSQNDLGKIVKIRNEEHSVLEAINRQLAHYCSHIGQIIFIAKMLKSDEWKSLSIPKNKSKEFNEKLMK